jgi:hypothetical protein
MEKEPNVEQPSVESQRTYASLRDNDATVVSILGTKKKYRIRWLKNGQIDRLSRLLIRKGETDNEDGSKDSPLDAIIEDSKLACKAAAIYILDGYWKLKFRYWYLWRWFYYVRQYDNIQLDKILEVGKKKVPQMQFFRTIMSLTEARDSLMRMRAKEVEVTLQELNMVARSQTESKDSGS